MVALGSVQRFAPSLTSIGDGSVRDEEDCGSPDDRGPQCSRTALLGEQRSIR
jgi:hypothetical protein